MPEGTSARDGNKNLLLLGGRGTNLEVNVGCILGNLVYLIWVCFTVN